MISLQTWPAVVRQRSIPEEIRSLDTFAKPDYADMFTTTAASMSAIPPAQWARAVFKNGPLRVRLVVLGAALVQRAILGMPAGRRHGDKLMFGWRIADGGDNWVRLESSSGLLSGHIILHRDGQQVSGATFVRYNRRLAALIWPPVAVVHRWVARFLVRHAATIR